MMKHVNQALSLIRSKSGRITKARKKIINIIYQSKRPISAFQVLKVLSQQDIKVNKTTVYRELSFLLKHNLVKEVKLAPFMIHYESSFLDHHHHLVCTKCQSVEGIVCHELEESIEKLKSRAAKRGFFIKQHDLEFYGNCAACI